MKATCVFCDRPIGVVCGKLRPHGPDFSCLGSNLDAAYLGTLILPPLTDEQLAMMRECGRIGDKRPIEIQFGIELFTVWYNPTGPTLEDELHGYVRGTRYLIEQLIRISQAHAARRVP